MGDISDDNNEHCSITLTMKNANCILYTLIYCRSLNINNIFNFFNYKKTLVLYVDCVLINEYSVIISFIKNSNCVIF